MYLLITCSFFSLIVEILHLSAIVLTHPDIAALVTPLSALRKGGAKFFTLFAA
jgi:hypothetical protein